MYYLLAGLIAYLAGSIPAAVWISKGIYKDDVRKHGSGNAGSTNMYRVFGFKAGLATQLIDIFKGALAALSPWIIFEWLDLGDVEYQPWFMLMFGGIGVLGHILPVFAGFKGGKGINSLLGMMLVINPWVTLACLGVFIIVLLATRYVSVGSMSAAFCFPIFTWLFPIDYPGGFQNILMIFGTVIFVLVVFTHRKNIQRLCAGNENKANLFRRKT